VGIKSELKKWVFWPDFGIWLQLLPLLLLLTMLWVVACHSLGLVVGAVRFWEHVIYGWTYAAAGYLVGLVLFARYLRWRWLAVGFAWFYFFIYGINIFMLHHAGVVLKPYYLRMADESDWTAYVNTRWAWTCISLFALNALLAAWLICRHTVAIRQLPVRGLVVLLAMLVLAVHLNSRGIFRPTAIVTKVTGLDGQKIWGVDQASSLRDVADNPLSILGWAIFHHSQPFEIRPASDLATIADNLKAWHLPLGKRQYPPLGLKPFNQIVVFATESLSLDYLSPYNTNLPPDLTPFYGSTTVTQAMFVNYKTVGLPSQPGIEVMYNSHPNVGGLLVGNSEQSLVKILNAQGYDTYFVMSASENFGDDRAIYGKIGFQHILGVETWRQDPKEIPFLEDRGLMDRALYDTVLNLLKQNRGRKIYIHIANMDTHGPYPRDFFGSLQYPPPPASLESVTPDAHARVILAGIFRHDYDIGNTIRRMREENLLGENTLVVLTADHNFPPADYLRFIPGYPMDHFIRIPLMFLSGQPLPTADLQRAHSQLDFAPTMAQLLGLPVPAGWWGESVFVPERSSTYVTRSSQNLIVESNGQQQLISYDHPQNPAERGLVDIFKTLYIDPALTNHPDFAALPPAQTAAK
jgi:phosphoglycerol transferase MdoB-like AlkP superfamily enzyme